MVGGEGLCIWVDGRLVIGADPGLELAEAAAADGVAAAEADGYNLLRVVPVCANGALEKLSPRGCLHGGQWPPGTAEPTVAEWKVLRWQRCGQIRRGVETC